MTWWKRIAQPVALWWKKIIQKPEIPKPPSKPFFIERDVQITFHVKFEYHPSDINHWIDIFYYETHKIPLSKVGDTEYLKKYAIDSGIIGRSKDIVKDEMGDTLYEDLTIQPTKYLIGVELPDGLSWRHPRDAIEKPTKSRRI